MDMAGRLVSRVMMLVRAMLLLHHRDVLHHTLSRLRVWLAGTLVLMVDIDVSTLGCMVAVFVVR